MRGNEGAAKGRKEGGRQMSRQRQVFETAMGFKIATGMGSPQSVSMDLKAKGSLVFTTAAINS